MASLHKGGAAYEEVSICHSVRVKLWPVTVRNKCTCSVSCSCTRRSIAQMEF